MIGLTLPDVDVWSERVTVALGQNPSLFTGPGTNTYLVGTGPRAHPARHRARACASYLPRARARAASAPGCDGIQEIVLTHGHPDHIGGVRAVLERFGALRVSKRPLARDTTRRTTSRSTPLDDGGVVRTEGATLRARPHAGPRAGPPLLRARGGAARSSRATTCSASAPP